MRHTGKRILTFLLSATLLGSLAMVGWQRHQSQLAEDAYARAEELAVHASRQETAIPEQAVIPLPTEPVELQPSQEAPTAAPEALFTEEPAPQQESPAEVDPFAEELAQTDLAALRAVNPDVAGWIAIPDTPVSYPLMQGEDNEYYLNHTWDRKASSAGSIFLDRSAGATPDHFNTIVYGHRMINNSMFGSLKYYEDADYWKAHPYVYILDNAGVHRYEIFSVYEASVKSYTYQIGFADDTAKETFLQKCIGWSVVETGVTPTICDRILTLSTCTGKGYDTRWVVQARLAAADDTLSH